MKQKIRHSFDSFSLYGIFVIALLSGCRSGEQSASTESISPFMVPPPQIISPSPKPAVPAHLSAKAVILVGKKNAEEVFKQCSRGAPNDANGYWTPTVRDILRMEAIGKDLAWSAEPGKAQKRVGDGYRQYVGFRRGKRRFIYINSFSDRAYDDKGQWKKEAVVVCDGGSDYWGVEYDVDAKTFANFATNGMV